MSKSNRARRRGLAVIVTFLLPVGGALAEPKPPASPLSLDAALSAAHRNNQLAAAARHGIEEAQGDLTRASILLVANPAVAIELGPRFSGTTGREVTPDVGVGLQQRFETGGQRGHRIALAQTRVEAATAKADAVRRVIDLAVARAFYSALAADRRQQLLEENAQLALELYEVARRRVDAGEGTPLEISASRIRLAEARRRTIAAQAAGKLARVRLTELLGTAPAGKHALRGDLPEAEDMPPIDALLARAVRDRPDLLAASREVDAARVAIDLADAEVWPDVQVGLSYGREESDDIVTAGVRVPIPLFNRNQGDRERTRSTRARLAAERDALALSVRSDVARALLVYEQAHTTLEIYDAEVLRAQEESLSLLQRAVEAGQVGIPDVIVVQREVVEGREGYLDVRLELAHARAAVLASAGLPQTAKLQGATQ